jgi:peptidoglycan-associated lipoprotein
MSASMLSSANRSLSFRARPTVCVRAIAALVHCVMLAVLGVTLAGCPGVEYPNCRGDQDCRQRREVCVNGRCQQCRNNADCAAEQTCLRNRCVPGLNACEGDNDCLRSQRCENHRCVPRTECDASRACPSGRACVEGRCVVEAEAPDPEDNRGRLCQFEPIYFGFDRDDLDATARASLARAAQCLERERTTRYVLIGRTDPRGTAEYNLALGERRARTVQRYLTALGVTDSRLAVSSEGMEAAQGTDEATWARDRRVDFRPRD